MRNLINLSNTLTMSRILLTPVFLYLIFAKNGYGQALALVVFAMCSLTDLYDGKLARQDGTVSKFGRFLDPLADKILISSALISFVFLGIVKAWLVAAIVIRDVIITILRSYAIYQGKQVITSKLSKWKTTIEWVTVLLVLAFINLKVVLAKLEFDTWFLLDDMWSYWLLNGLIAAAMLLALVSGIGYLRDHYRF